MNNAAIDDRTNPAYPRIGVGIVVLDGENVLLVKRGHEPAMGEWSVPGGLIKAGETIKQAAKRELMEECGIDARFHNTIDIFEFIEQNQDASAKYHFVVIEIFASYIGGKVRAASDAQDARWVARLELQDFACSDSLKNLVRKAFENRIRYEADDSC